MEKPPGCLSRSGLLAAAAAILVVFGLVWANGGAMFSPGPLNAQTGPAALGGVRAHADTGGECGRCHPPLWSRQTMANRCAVCHTTVAAELQAARGLHGALLAPGAPPTCFGCHTEHGGPDAPLTVIDPARFPHQAVGYSLQGHQTRAGGQPFTCDACHPQSPARFEAATCDACHRELDAPFAQAHAAAFGAACLACHDGVDTYGPTFDHNQVPFPLQGSHSAVDCAACHPGAQTIADLQRAPQDCYSCHRTDDPHGGQFGPDCAACHTPDDWEAATFDHNLSAFPLTGAHSSAECELCHTGGVFAGTPQDCYSCHLTDDPHGGQFGPDCAACHTSTAWIPAGYTGPHTFPINHGESGPRACRTCHPDGLQTYTCYDCHEHTPAKIESKHREEGIRNFENCVQCHPTGREEEGEGEGD